MEYKVNENHVYFWIEPNIVIMYKLDLLKYITLEDMRRKNKAIFEIENESAFPQFNHEEHTPVKGMGLFLDEESTQTMLQIINEQVKKQKSILKPQPLIKQPDFYHSIQLVSNESIAGSIQAALHTSQEIIAFDLMLTFGPIWNLENRQGQSLRNDWMYENINFPFPDDHYYRNSFYNTLMKLDDIEEGSSLFIWYGNNTEEQLFIRFVLYLLRDKKFEIYLMNTTTLLENEAIETKTNHKNIVSLLTPEIHENLFQSAKNKLLPLSNEEATIYIHDWEEFSEENGLLRVWENNKINNVSENYYDEVIIRTLENLHQQDSSKDYVQVSKLVWGVVDRLDEANSLHYVYLEYRIRYLVYNGTFELKGIPKSMRHYFVKVR